MLSWRCIGRARDPGRAVYYPVLERDMKVMRLDSAPRFLLFCTRNRARDHRQITRPAWQEPVQYNQHNKHNPLWPLYSGGESLGSRVFCSLQPVIIVKETQSISKYLPAHSEHPRTIYLKNITSRCKTGSLLSLICKGTNSWPENISAYENSPFDIRREKRLRFGFYSCSSTCHWVLAFAK